MLARCGINVVVSNERPMKGATMIAMKNNYKVIYKTSSEPDWTQLDILAEIDCDEDRYMYELSKALKNGLSIYADNSYYRNDDGSRDYTLTIFLN